MVINSASMFLYSVCRLVDEPKESTLFRYPSAKREDF